MSPLLFVIIVVILAWIYDFYNGVNDRANAIATTISTRAMTPHQAILVSAILNILGAFVTTQVAKTIGKGIVDPAMLQGDQILVIAALIGTIIWVVSCTRAGIPISISHSLVGGIMGAAIMAAGGISLLQWAGIKKILLGMVFSPLLGFGGAFILVILLLWLFRRAQSYFANTLFRRVQVGTTVFLSFTHGMNDTQNAMGVITMALFVGGFITTFHVPWWVIAGSGFFMGAGTYIAGWRVMKTMGMKIVKLTPIHAVSSETASSLVILGASLLGIPISTTHAVATSIMGVGASKKLSAVRWGVVWNIVIAWILTFPGSGIMSALAYIILKQIVH